MPRGLWQGMYLLLLLLLASQAQLLSAGQDDTEPDERARLELELRNVVGSWASAWQSQLDDIYLLHYHPEFRPEGGASRQAWEEMRRNRVNEPEYIRISLREFDLRAATTTTAVVRFTLNYSRPGYADSTRKEILLARNGQLWQILRETNLWVQRLPDPE